MNLKNVLKGIKGLKAKGELDLELAGIESNSKNVKQDFMFVAIKGFSVDGHEFVNSAIENGAKVIVVQEGCDLKKFNLNEDITLIVSQDTREFLAFSV